MNYIDGEPLHYDTAESQDEAAAAHQMALDALHRIGCQYNIATQDVVLLCQLAQINVDELMNHTGVPA